jgi:hypothetical protein
MSLELRSLVERSSPQTCFSQLSSISLNPAKLSQELKAKSQEQILKDREDETSQLNRLGVAYFLMVYFRFLPHLTSAFRRRNSFSYCFSAIQVLTTSKQLANSSSGSN